jgi:hypothetical protein
LGARRLSGQIRTFYNIRVKVLVAAPQKCYNKVAGLLQIRLLKI